MAVVQQDAGIAHDTIMGNIIYGRDFISEQDAARAAEISLADDFIRRLPDGYETEVFSSGVSISGGERQRLAIARALAGNPDVLVLDDSTSSLDYATEMALIRSLKRTMGKMAVVLITQRKASLMCADRVVTLRNGHAFTGINA